jgi:uncharacterized membrane protein
MVALAPVKIRLFWIQTLSQGYDALETIRVYQTNTEICLKDGLQFKIFTTSLSREREQKLEEEFGG